MCFSLLPQLTNELGGWGGVAVWTNPKHKKMPQRNCGENVLSLENVPPACELRQLFSSCKSDFGWHSSRSENTVQLWSGPNSSAPPVNSVRSYILPNSPSIPWDCVIFRWVSCYFCLNGRQNGPPPWMDLFRTSSREPSQCLKWGRGFCCVCVCVKTITTRTTRAVWSHGVMKKGTSQRRGGGHPEPASPTCVI